MKYDFLDNIDNPSDLRILSTNDLDNVSEELRHFLIDTVSQCGGHFGASLGAVELTVALHYSFDTPKDKWRKCCHAQNAEDRKKPLIKIRSLKGLWLEKFCLGCYDLVRFSCNR